MTGGPGTGEQRLFCLADQRLLGRIGLYAVGGDSSAADQCDQPTQRPHPMDRLQHSHAEEYPRKIGKKRRKNAEKCLRREAKNLL